MHYAFVFLCVYFAITQYHVRSLITGPTHGKVVVCYIGTWAVYRPGRGSFSLEHIDPNQCTHLVYSFAGLNATQDSIAPLDPWQDLTESYGKGGYERIVRLKDRFPHLKITLAIGGWNEGSANYSLMASDASRRKRFVANAVEFIRKYNFDGLDLDWEFPGKRGGNPEDKQNFLLLVKDIRAVFNQFNLLLTAAFGAGKDTIDVAYDVAGLAQYLDFIHMMCYDYHGAWDLKTGANAPLRSQDVYSVAFSIDYMLQLGAPANKLVMGIPLYGRTFVLADSRSPSPLPRLGALAKSVGFQGPFTKENGFMGYNEICLEMRNKSSGFSAHWDAESRTPFLASAEKLISYDDARSISEKIQFAMKRKLAGAMVWSIDTDDFEGDCADSGTAPSNFPLMRSLNKAIEAAIQEAKHAAENEIPHGDRDKSLAGKVLQPFVLILSLYCMVLCLL